MKKNYGLVIVKKAGETKLCKVNANLFGNKDFTKKLHNALEHVCTNCDNCYADSCVKVADSIKASIVDYEFISDGVQVFDINGDTRYLYVTGCNNFKEDEKRHKPTTQEEIAALNRIKESIKIAYFDAETIEEADQTQLDLLRRKQIMFTQEYVCKRK